MKRFATITLYLVIVSALMPAQSSWEGTAAAARYGEFPPDGYYAASSAFPRNTIVEVTNASTGQSISAIVVRRSTDPGILVLLSQEAASALGISPSSPVQVEMRRVTQPDLTRVDPSEDLPFHPDPDINPAAGAGDPNEEILSPPTEAERRIAEAPPSEAAGPSEPAAREEPVAEEPAATAPPAEEAPTEAPEPELSEPRSAPSAEEPEETEPPAATPPAAEPPRLAEAPEIVEPPQRSVVPVPRSRPATPQTPTEEPAPEPAEEEVAPLGPAGPTVVPVPSRRPPVAEQPSAEGAPLAEGPAEAPSAEDAERPLQQVVPVPSRRPPAAQAPAAEAPEAPADDVPRRGLASGVRGAAGTLALRDETRPEAALRRPAVEDTGADVAITRVPAPQAPATAITTQEELPEVTPERENPLERAVAAVAGRMPRDQLFPPPRGGEVATLLRRPESPAESDIAPERLAEARVPEVEAEQPAVEMVQPETPPAAPVDPADELIAPPDEPAERPFGALAEADSRIEEPEIVEREVAPGDERYAPLAEARPGEVPDEEMPSVAGREPAPEDVLDAPLPRAEVVGPEATVAAPEAPRGEDLDVRIAEPGLAEEPRLVDDRIDAEYPPEDAVLALEPADFRPPPAPEAGIARPQPGEEVAPEARAPVLPESPEALARLSAEERALEGESAVPGAPPRPEELARAEAEEEALAAAEPEPGVPPEEVGPEAGTRIAGEEGAVDAAEREPAAPGPPEAGVRAEAAPGEGPRVTETEAPVPPDEPRGDARITVKPGPETEPAAVAIAEEPRDTAEWARKNLPLVGKLSSGSYYLQVGAYSSPRSAKSAIDGLAQDYPVAVLPAEAEEQTVYRLFVGPLNEDERGTMLYWFRARGFKDAFIRKGD